MKMTSQTVLWIVCVGCFTCYFDWHPPWVTRSHAFRTVCMLRALQCVDLSQAQLRQLIWLAKSTAWIMPKSFFGKIQLQGTQWGMDLCHSFVSKEEKKHCSRSDQQYKYIGVIANLFFLLFFWWFFWSLDCKESGLFVGKFFSFIDS